MADHVSSYAQRASEEPTQPYALVQPDGSFEVVETQSSEGPEVQASTVVNESYKATYNGFERDLLRSGISHTSFAILRYLISRSDEMGRCFPSQGTIGADCRLEPRTVRIHLEKLEKLDLVRYLRRQGRDPITGQQMNNVYIITPSYLMIGDKFRRAPRLYGTGLRMEL